MPKLLIRHLSHPLSFIPLAMVQCTGILDLPTEILVKILDRSIVSIHTLRSLAVLCRRLHFIALPIYFSRYGLTPTSKSVVIDMCTNRRDLLAVLQMALFIPETESITCIFPHPSCISIFPVLRHLKRLQNYISRLPSVKHVTLRLDDADSVCLSVGNDHALRAWTTHLEDLLNCIVEKHCTSLTMRYGGQLTRAYDLGRLPTHRAPMIPRLLDAIAGLLHQRGSETEEFHRDSLYGYRRIEMTLPSSCSQSAELTSLQIHSTILLVPPGLRWTLTALRDCPITSLTLDRGVENTIIWNTVLPLVGSAARGLTTLILLQADFLPEVDILDFIAQLPLLRHLTISCRNKPDIRLKNSPPTPLRDLETLRAPSPYVHYLLRSPSCLPKIQSICILWPEIYVNATTAIAAALSALSEILDAHGRAPRLVVSVTTIYHSAILANPIDALRAFLDRVEVLEIAAAPFLSSDITNMAHCIRLFPRVRRVEIAIPTVHQFREDLTRLLRAVKSTQYLQQIEVNGETYDLVHV